MGRSDTVQKNRAMEVRDYEEAESKKQNFKMNAMF